ncbi:hypothetical protein SAMN05421750_12016 [Agrobacterium pusense]|nr:hypothetical protein SAMN05421750_12016 [Agrobacterium pusense]
MPFLITMSQKELHRLEVIQKIHGRRLNVVRATSSPWATISSTAARKIISLVRSGYLRTLMVWSFMTQPHRITYWRKPAPRRPAAAPS